MRGPFAGALAAVLLLGVQARAQSPSPPPSGQPPAEQQQPDKPGEAQPDEQQVYEDQVVVTASRREQTLVNAPATVSLITNETLLNSGCAARIARSILPGPSTSGASKTYPPQPTTNSNARPSTVPPSTTNRRGRPESESGRD